MQKLRIVIADDSLPVREQLEQIFSQLEGFKVVGVAGDGAHAFWMVQVLNPDVLIMDLTLPRVSGLEVLQEIRKTNHSVVIIVLTTDPILILRDACLKAGANYYVNKAQVDHVVEICQRLIAGRRISA